MPASNDLGTKPIGSLLLRNSIPAIIAMLVNAVYNVVDRIFIGRYAGEEALGGLTVSFPVMMIIFAFATLVGVGGNALLSIKLGEKKDREAGRIFGSMIGLSLIMAAAAFLGISLNLNGLLVLFGATEGVIEYAADYLTIILGGFIFQMISFSLINSIRSEGHPLRPMISLIASAVTNMFFDYLFIAVLGWEVRGAAAATVLGQITGFIILVSFYVQKKSRLSLELKDFIPDGGLSRRIFTIGFASFAETLGSSIAMAVLNRGLRDYGGTQAIVAMGAINSLYTFFIMPIMGIQQGTMPIIGYNHGARQENRTWQTLRLASGAAVLLSTGVFFILELSALGAVTLFIDSESPTATAAAMGLRIFLLSMPVVSLNLLGVAYFQATAQGTKSLVHGMLRQFLFLIPLALIFPRIWGLTGVWLATPVADILASALTAGALVLDHRKTKGRSPQPVLCIEGPQKEPIQ